MVDIEDYNNDYILTSLGKGSYFGDITLFLNIKSKMVYRTSMSVDCYIYSIKGKLIKDFMKLKPEYENVYKLRAMRRLYYLKTVYNLYRDNND